jgi:hypothetical protein
MQPPAPLTGLEGIFGTVVTLAIGFAGIVVFIMFIMGGFSYLTAGGNPQAVEGAKKTLTFAIAGLVIIALSFLILKLITQFTGVDVTTFKVSQ